ncbi:flagellar basal-body rod protein FlgF [Xanthobacter sp. 126]|uniref:flagellar basal-body rod protein FlgF n=1 Tax=Xanthobacter sp. 126 TaxID=1131814 RepID=UPI00045EB38D|nr:flagellar basal-body rod protein FlgF [Xanthobacter sp. 126]
MGSGLYVSLSAQLAADKRLTTIANNVANLNTAGYRAEEVRFEEMVSRAGGEDVSFTSTGETYTSRKSGPINPTGNPLDIAVEGKGWFAVRDGATTAYTRDGRMSMSPEGELRTLSGRPILDASGAPVVIDPTGGTVRIGTDGSISQNRRAIGRVGLFLIPEDAKLARRDGALVVPDKPAALVQDYTRNVVRQGFVEGANVDAVTEMTRLIALQRAFEMAASAVSQTEDSTSQTIRELGPG